MKSGKFAGIDLTSVTLAKGERRPLLDFSPQTMAVNSSNFFSSSVCARISTVPSSLFQTRPKMPSSRALMITK